MYKVNIKEGNKNRTIEREKLLTIGIITKNEPERLERCLKSLIPIREAIDCEIIVTDTGSTDNTVEVAEKYADKVLYFEWCDDFAAARNTGIDAAKGLWFMWIDSDEWIEKPESLIEFFRSGEHKKHFAVTFNLVNIINYEKNINSENMICRMILLNRNNRFVGKIHEYIYNHNYVVTLKLKIYHDGYTFNNLEERKEKHYRNIDLLLKSHYEDPEDIDIIRYIVVQYRFNDEYKKSNEYCDKGIALIDKKRIIHEIDKAHKLNYIITKSANYLELKKYDEAIIGLNNLVDDDKKLSNRFIDIYFILFETYKKLEDLEKTVDFGKKYIEYYSQNEYFDKTYSTVFAHIYNRKDIAIYVISYLINNEILDDLTDISELSFIKYIKCANFEDGEFSNGSELSNYTSDLFKLAKRFNRYEIISHWYKSVIESQDEADIKLFEINLIEFISDNKDSHRDIFYELSNIESNLPIIMLSRIISNNGDLNTTKIQSDLEDVFKNDIDNINIKSEFIYLAIKYKIDFMKFRDKLDIFTSNLYIKSLIFKKSDYIDNIMNYYQNYKDRSKVDFLLFIVFMIEGLRVEKEDDDMISNIYYVYREILPKIIKYIYNTETMDETTIDMYPPIFRFGYFIERADIFKKTGNLSAYIDEIKKSVLNFPPMVGAVKQEIKSLESELENENERQKELNKLSQEVRRQLDVLIANGRNSEALDIALQLKAIQPNDSDIKEICSRLSGI